MPETGFGHTNFSRRSWLKAQKPKSKYFPPKKTKLSKSSRNRSRSLRKSNKQKKRRQTIFKKYPKPNPFLGKCIILCCLVEVRGIPHGVFRPREGGLTRIRCFRVVSCRVFVVVVVGFPKSKNLQISARAAHRRPEIQKNRQKSKISRMIQNDSK